MTTVLEVLWQQGLYFLDSRTSADTVGYSLARHMGIKAAERQVFLDTERDSVFIRSQFDTLLATARKRGAAIAKKSYAEGRPLKEVAREMTDLTDEELDRLLDPAALTEGGIQN